MPDLIAAARAVAALANTPITDFTKIPTMEAAFASEPWPALFQALRGTSQDEKTAVLDILATALNGADSYHTNCIAIICGSLVEAGCPAERVAPALLQHLPGQLTFASRIVALPDDVDRADVFRREPESIKAWASLRFLLLATMTVFCRHMPSRIAARANPAIMEPLPSLAEYSAEADYLAQLLSYTDAMEVVVLHPEARKGWLVRLEAIHSHPHFHTLLQARLIGDLAQGLLPYEPTDPDVIAVARNEAKPSPEQYDHARFECYFAEALQTDGSLNGLWITSETIPNDYSLVDGERVVLLGKLMLGGRSWDAGFFANIHDALRSDVVILETLTPAQVSDWLKRIQARDVR